MFSPHILELFRSAGVDCSKITHRKNKQKIKFQHLLMNFKISNVDETGIILDYLSCGDEQREATLIVQGCNSSVWQRFHTRDAARVKQSLHGLFTLRGAKMAPLWRSCCKGHEDTLQAQLSMCMDFISGVKLQRGFQPEAHACYYLFSKLI